MSETIKVISDIHGCYDELELLLQKANYHPDRDRLVLLGDYVDRGPKSMQVVKRVMELVEKYGAVALGGNHEEMFLDWLDEKVEGDFYLREIVGGRTTVQSYCASFGHHEADERARKIIAVEHFEHVEFLRGLPDWYELEGHIFVHAGINPFVEDWKETDHKELRWIRTPFHQNPHRQAQTVVFGHTPTRVLHEDEQCGEVWHGEKIIGIDGGCAFGLQLNCLEIQDGEYFVHAVKRLKA